MKYDLIVVGGGPGGLMAAKTAAAQGLKVLLVERKKKLAKVDRACLQVFYLRWVCPDGYLEPTSVQFLSDKTVRFHLLGPGCSVDYRGPLKPYTNAIWVSPSGNTVHHFKNEPFGFFYDKEHLLAGLLAEAEKAGVEVMTGTIAQGAENTPDGVKIFVRNGAGEKALEARKAIAADGINSIIVDSLGLNEKRQVFNPNFSLACYAMEGVEPDIPGNETAWLHLHIPSLPGGSTRIGVFGGDTRWVDGGWETLKKLPRFAPWFSRARVVKKMAFAMVMRTVLREPVCGNVVIVGDAGATTEAWIQGAMACGYQAVKAIIKELNGQSGCPEYVAWWQKAFYFNDPGYFKRIIALHTIDRICTEEEIDHLYQLLQDKGQLPHLAIARNLELIKGERPELYDRLRNYMDKMTKKFEPLLATFPPDSIIFKEPDAYLDRWRT